MIKDIVTSLYKNHFPGVAFSVAFFFYNEYNTYNTILYNTLFKR